jgi:hypothetical protein
MLSQAKMSMPRRENLKILFENEVILKKLLSWIEMLELKDEIIKRT